MQTVKFIFKYICYALIFTSLQIGCSGNIQKFGAKKEKRQVSCSNRSQQKIGSMGTEMYSCDICLEEYANNDNCIKLPCSDIRLGITHSFHKSCIHQWIKNKEHPICPVCISPIDQDIIANMKKYTLLNLFQAIKAKDLNKVQWIVKNNPCLINEADKYGYTLLHWVTNNGYTEIIQVLLTVPGINVNKVDQNGYNILHHAMLKGNTVILQMLLKLPSIDINKVDIRGDTLLHFAIMLDNPEIVQMLLKVPGIDVNKVNIMVESPFNVAVIGRNTAIIEMLRPLKTDPMCRIL